MKINRPKNPKFDPLRNRRFIIPTIYTAKSPPRPLSSVPVRTRTLVRSNVLQTHFWNQQKRGPLFSTSLLSIHERRSVSTSRALFLHTRSQSQTVLLRDLDSCDLFVCSDWIAAPSRVLWTVSFAHVQQAFEQQCLKLIFLIHESSAFYEF